MAHVRKHPQQTFSHPNHLCCENTLSVPMSFAREAQPLLPDDFNIEDAVDATETGAQARPLLSAGETLEDFGGQESLDDWLTRRFCEGRLSALQSARAAAAAVRSGAQGDRVIAVAQGASQCSQNAQRSMLRRALRGSRLPPLYWADVPLWSPLDARCVSTPVPFLLIHELVLQLVSDDTVGDWLGWADGREELAITLEDWKKRVDMSSQGPPCAAFSLWGDTAPYHTGFDSVMLLLWSPLTGTVRQRFWFGALSKQTLCKCGCGGRHTLEPCWNVAKWCFDNMLRGCMATERHDGGPWLASDRWSESRWLVVTASSRDAAIPWGLALVVGDAWIGEPRECPVLLQVRYEEGRPLDGSEPSRCMAKDAGRPR